MVKKTPVKTTAASLDEHDLTLEVAPLPVTESEALPVVDEVDADAMVETAAITVTEGEVEAVGLDEPKVEVLSKVGNEDHPDIKILEQKIAELEDKFLKLQTELYLLIDKKKKKTKKGSKRNTDKVKCKCKDKKVDIAECKCNSKKVNK